MSYPSIDALQKALGAKFFHNRQDVKKAAGRAMGTIVELITFYIVRQWGFLPHLTIEKGLAEFANDSITHNVEFGLHAVQQSAKLPLVAKPPISASSLLKAIAQGGGKAASIGVGFAVASAKATQLLSKDGLLRNACTLAAANDELLVANLDPSSRDEWVINLCRLSAKPFAMVECKRVGVEDGAKKGPTTIEKAKQGAYVAKHVSALQKVRGRDGKIYGVMPLTSGEFQIRELAEEIRRLVFEAPVDELDGFTLTVGVVSNHGNWFTKDDPNKELAVLKQSYDWLLFLSDAGIVEFVTDTILSPTRNLAPIKKAFEDSYRSGKSGSNRFTKVRVDIDAHHSLCEYFSEHIDRIQSDWFRVLAPGKGEIDDLRSELGTLARRLSR
jgi:hypothetical protein